MTAVAPAAIAVEGGLGSAAPPKRAQFGGFDGLRAVAALTVVVTHASFTSGANVRHWAGAYFARMDAGVSIFFLISGFLLYRPFVAARVNGTSPLGLAGFLRRRVLRIFPAYWVALTVVVFVLGHAEFRSVADALAFYGLLQIYDPQRITGGIGQAWSLATELSFYLFLPGYAALLRRLRGGYATELAALGGLVLIAVGWKLYVLDGGGTHRLTWLPAYLDLFAMGMFLAVASVWSDSRQRGVPILGWLGRYGLTSWAFAAITFWVVATQVGLPRGFEDITVTQALLRHGLYGATGFFLLLPAVFGTGRSSVERLLAWRPMVFLGLISYGIYVWHKALIHEVQRALDAPLFDIDLNLLLGWTLAGTLVVSTLSYILVEEPALRLKGRSARERLTLTRRDLASLIGLLAVTIALGPLFPRATPAVPTSTAPAPLPRPTAPTAAPLPGTGVLILGDSVMFDGAPALEAALAATGDFRTRSETVLGAGLARTQDYDWRERWPELMREVDPEAVILHVGGWDLLPRIIDGREVGPADVRWQEWYGGLLADAVSVLAPEGTRLYLLGAAREGDAAALSVDAYNTLLREFAHDRERVTFVDTDPVLDAQAGAVRPGLEAASGRVYKTDGVHLCAAGATALARAVGTVVAADHQIQLGTGWELGEWRFLNRYRRASEGCALARDGRLLSR